MAAKQEVVVSVTNGKEAFWASQRTRVGISTVLALIFIGVVRAQVPLVAQYITAEQFTGLVQGVSIVVGTWIVGRSIRNTPASK